MILKPTNNIENLSQDKELLFLAGTMASGEVGNWRSEVILGLGNRFNYLDPTNKNHNKLKATQMQNHIGWELEALKRADKIILNFLPESLSPISLVELCIYVASNKLIVLCPKGFYKNRYINILCKKYNTPYFDKLSDSLDFIKKRIVL